MKTVTLNYLPQFKAFGISDEEIAKFEKDNIIPELVLMPRNTEPVSCYRMRGNYKILNVPETFPFPVTIGFLMGREKGYYTVDWNYARTLAKTGAHIKFLTYEHPIEQFAGCKGLILPGGCFASPEEYYTDPGKPKKLSARAEAYVNLINHGLANHIPMLGICAGAQMIGGALGLKMYRNQSYLKGTINHKSKEVDAHKIYICRDNPICMIYLNRPEAWVNSRHNESIVNDRSQSKLKFYAYSEDGVPEAWGSDELGILCVQWHPEDKAAQGKQIEQNIYNWLVAKAVSFNW